MIIKNNTRAEIEALVKSGFGNFNWAGTGITSTSANANIGNAATARMVNVSNRPSPSR